MEKSFKVGDICTYHYADDNGSLSIVQITEIVSVNISRIKILQAVTDNSGNGFFEYMQSTNGEMNASNMYLHKIDIVEHYKAKIETLQKLLGGTTE